LTRLIAAAVKIGKEEGLNVLPAVIPTTDRERALRKEAYRAAIANLRLEGLEMDDEAKQIFQRHIDGEITSEEFRTAIDDQNEREFRPCSGNGRA
jgi:Antitoxin VbhA